VYEAWQRWPQRLKPVFDTAQTQAMEPSQDAVTAKPASTTPSRIILPPPEGGVQVVLVAKERTWVEAFNGGQRIFMGLLHPGETKILEGTDRVRVLVGNAGGIEIRHNGKPIGAPGAPGEVMTLDFTLSDHSVVPVVEKPRA
jgi:hypothetical protein